MDATRKYCIEWDNSDPDRQMPHVNCLSLLWIFRFITYDNKRNKKSKIGPRVGKRKGYLEKGTAGHGCYKKGTGKMVGTLIGKRVEWTEKKEQSRDNTKIISKRLQVIMLTKFCCLHLK